MSDRVDLEIVIKISQHNGYYKLWQEPHHPYYPIVQGVYIGQIINYSYNKKILGTLMFNTRFSDELGVFLAHMKQRHMKKKWLVI